MGALTTRVPASGFSANVRPQVVSNVLTCAVSGHALSGDRARAPPGSGASGGSDSLPDPRHGGAAGARADAPQVTIRVPAAQQALVKPSPHQWRAQFSPRSRRFSTGAARSTVTSF
eukprot:5865497-Pyramimonas_sp.AAC.1